VPTVPHCCASGTGGTVGSRDAGGSPSQVVEGGNRWTYIHVVHPIASVFFVSCDNYKKVVQSKPMACVPGRCPCWPQAEPFDAAEMALLKTVQAGVTAHWSAEEAPEALWRNIQTQCLPVRRHRRAYILSVPLARPIYNGYDITLLRWTSNDMPKVQWLLDVGVCPNIAAASVTFECWKACTWGRVHPGRPLQASVISPLSFTRIDSKIWDLFVTAGAYDAAMEDLMPRMSARRWRRQWNRWHGRSGRRAWAAAVMCDEC
jgi:hypothetical protein